VAIYSWQNTGSLTSQTCIKEQFRHCPRVYLNFVLERCKHDGNETAEGWVTAEAVEAGYLSPIDRYYVNGESKKWLSYGWTPPGKNARTDSEYVPSEG